jgi:hypothetical protein
VRRITGTPGNPSPLVFAGPGITTTGGTMFDLAPAILVPGINYLLGIGLNHLEFEQPVAGRAAAGVSRE